MAVPVLAAPPDRLTAGDSVAWAVSAASCLPADGWQATAYLRGAGSLDVVGSSSDGDRFTFTLSAASTASLPAGSYAVTIRALRHPDAVTLWSGTLTLAPNPALQQPGESLSWAERTLAVIEARLAGDLSDGVLRYMIGTRQVERYALPELMALRTRLRAEVRARRGTPFGAIALSFRGPR